MVKAAIHTHLLEKKKETTKERTKEKKICLVPYASATNTYLPPRERKQVASGVIHKPWSTFWVCNIPALVT